MNRREFFKKVASTLALSRVDVSTLVTTRSLDVKHPTVIDDYVLGILRREPVTFPITFFTGVTK